MAAKTTWELYDMFEAFLQAPAYHLGLEGILLVMIIWLVFHKSYKPDGGDLTEKEKEQLIAEWTPEPLIPKIDPNHFSLHPKTVSGKMGKLVLIDGKKCLNFATHSYLGLTEHPELETAAIDCLRRYGVGSCGPRGFYGTVDIHLQLEAKLAKFMQVEEAVLYSYGFSTISSAIPAYAKTGDVIFCDEGVNFAVQKGLVGSRSEIKFFKHNDTEDLERLFVEQEAEDRANPRKARATRRFLVVEGISFNYGDICPLPKLLELKARFKARLFIDETCSFGVLGATGRGVTEHFNIPIEDVDLISSTLESAIPAYGGFCCGSSFIVDHQRLSGLGYCFSASLPPLQAGVAIAALDVLESNPGLVTTLRENCIKVHQRLDSIPLLRLQGNELSPVKHLYLPVSFERDEAMEKLTKIVDLACDEGLGLTVARYLELEEHCLPPPSIRITVSAFLNDQDIQKFINVLTKACEMTI